MLVLFCASDVIAQAVEERPQSADAASAAAAVVAHGASLFKSRCASCHDPAVDRAPPKVALARRFPDDIATALKTGVMQPMAADLSDADIRAIATYLGSDGMTEQAGDPPACGTAGKFSMSGPGWNGWSIDARNSRNQPNPGLSGAVVPRLKVKWSMTYTGGRYGQPIMVGGRLFLTSSSGRLYALDAKTGCMHWRFDAEAGVRTTPVIGQLRGAAPSGYSMFFGDFQRNVYALDAASGKLQWKVNVEQHPRGVLTGAPVLYRGLLYVPISSWEETAGGIGSYGCCSARGGLAALDARDGRLVWKTYAIEQQPQPTTKNSAGTQMYGPAGAAVWSAPTIDVKRRVVYIGTGDTYTDVKENGSDAIIALDLATGKVKWRNQVTENDSFLMGCNRSGTVNCPKVVGPDHDFGASPILFTLHNGKDIILAGQKSGVAFGMDPDHDGKTVWRNKVGNGGALGGIEWGMAADATQLYVAVADLGMPPPTGKAGLYALDPATGGQQWYTAAPKVPCSYSGRCLIGQSAAPSVIPGLVLSTTIDGHLRAYDVKDGKIVWDFDTAAQKYQTINGIKDQSGGSLDVAGPILAAGMMYIISGYAGALGGAPDNVLLAFSVDGK
ncbi:MAG TPA: PQQ-binding-like beta-propeller repeat protein [Steroidobacteraceae bacterium]|nr:PQQ-binding-like beta-propeller repeat protein [Steroidobacteraceae bacterium]